MWTYTAYILNRFGEKNGYSEINFKELSNRNSDNLWRKHHLVFHDGEEDLRDDLRYLDRMGMIKFDHNKIRLNCAHLAHVSRIVEDSPLLTGVKLFEEYNRRIDEAFDSYQVPKMKKL